MNLSTHNSTSTALTVPVFTQEVIQESFTSFDRFMNGVGERIQETGPLFQAVSDAHRYMTSDPQVPVVIRGLMNNEQVISAIHSDPGVQCLLRNVSIAEDHPRRFHKAFRGLGVLNGLNEKKSPGILVS